MSGSFKSAVQASRALQEAAQRSRDPLVAQQAQIIARLVKNLAQIERGLDEEGRQLAVRLGKLGKRSSQASKAAKGRGGFQRPGYDDVGYYVEMVGSRGQGRRPTYRAADTGLVGRRIGRGPVRMASPGGNVSTRALSAAFGRLLAAQSQLQQLKSEMDRIRQRT
jgi:small-conductance mechanosensitive channel